MQRKIGTSLKILTLVLLPVIFFFATICIGRYSVSVNDVYASFKALFTGNHTEIDPKIYSVVIGIRAQRALQGLLVGASLAASGAASKACLEIH